MDIDLLLFRKDGKGVLPFQGLAPVTRGKIDLKAVLAGFRKDTIPDLNVPEPHLAGLP